MARISSLLETESQPDSREINRLFLCTFTFLSKPLFPNVCRSDGADSKNLPGIYFTSFPPRRAQAPGLFHLALNLKVHRQLKHHM